MMADVWTVLAQTSTTIVETVNSRNNAALPVMFLAVVVLAGFALAAPKWARKINARKRD
jgi:hypothetical protein